MTDMAQETQQIFDPNIVTPEMEMAEKGRNAPDAADLSIDEINPLNPHLFKEDRWQDHFARLRSEDPVHFNQTELAGRFWSLTRYEDIKQVDVDWKNFSSAKGIALGFPVDAPLPEGALKVSMFIAQDPPVHDVQRKTVAGVVAPSFARPIAVP